MRNLLKILLVLATASASFAARAQEDYRFDIGGGIGMTGYLGDASSNLYASPSWDAEILFRYIYNPRFNFKTNFYVGGLGGDTSKMDDILPDGENFKFTTTFYELGEMVEFHFFNYGMGERYRKLKRWTPYITAEIGRAHV